MTKNQLYFAIGIPSCLFALNFLAIRASAFWQVKRFEDLSKRFDDMSKRFDDMKDWVRSEISRVAGVLGAKIDGLTLRVKALELVKQ